MSGSARNAHIVIVGGNFAGYAGALELRSLLGPEARITVVSRSTRFVYTPSLVLLPFRFRRPEEISFELGPILASRGIELVTTSVTSIDIDGRRVMAESGPIPYDYLLLATGFEADESGVEGFTESDTCSIWTLEGAMATREKWRMFLEHPGHAVIGSVRGAPPLGVPYEFALNAQQQLAEQLSRQQAAGPRRDIDAGITFLTPAKHLAHFGAGGFADAENLCERTFSHLGICWRTDAVVTRVGTDHVTLATGEVFPSRFTMLIPPFVGASVVRNTPGLGDERGYIQVDARFRHVSIPRIYGAGMAVNAPPELRSFVVGGTPATIYPAERMGRIAAANIVAEITGREAPEMTLDELTTSARHDMGSISRAFVDQITGRRAFEALSPTARGRASRDALERYYLDTRGRGMI